jgi:hypothetical protein
VTVSILKPPRYATVSEAKRLKFIMMVKFIMVVLCDGHSPTEKCPFGLNGYVTTVALALF